MATPSTIIRKPYEAVAGALEEVGRQLGFVGKVLVQVPAALRPKRLSVVLNLMSDITIGAGALIVGGGMIFVIFSMSFFTGTEVGLQGYSALNQIGTSAFAGFVSAYINTREIVRSSRLVSRAEFVESMERLGVALSLTNDRIVYENPDLDAYLEARRDFSRDDWLDLIMRTIGLEPTAYELRGKLLLLDFWTYC